MNSRLKNGIALSLIPQIILVKWLGSYPELIEAYYSKGVYPVISGFFRSILGWVPFSVGDIVYASLLFLAIRYLYLKRGYIKQRPKIFLRNMVVVLSIAYFTFHLLWGLNYYRKPISETLHITETYSKRELSVFVENLIKKTNKIHLSITADSLEKVEIPYNQSEVRKKTVQGYEKLKKRFPFLKYERPSLKNSVFSVPLTYMGYGGYLNPFTNEAQVNAKLPNFRFPVVCGHEVGHQVGYSAENETNFIGYLVTSNNDDIYFQYAANAYALGYCLSAIRRKDVAAFEKLYTQLNLGVKKNFQEIADFWEAHENPLEPVFKSVFNSFLKINDQEDGIKSYGKVVALLVTYHKKHPL
ncbi:MAG: DUF3810 domain-containing protein [Bacteroidota bacterium]